MSCSPASRSERFITRAVVTAGVLGATAGSASAYLGSFAPADGYHLNINVGAVNWADVSYYNAGQYGVNAGNGPGPTLGTPNSGLWSVVGQVGGFFPNAALRNANTPPNSAYSPTLPSGTLPIYIVGNHGPGRTDNSALAFRNHSPAGTGAAEYDYQIDTYDTGGPIPATITSGTVNTSFYFLPNPDAPSMPGTRPADKFHLSWMDGGGNIGVQWGYARDNEVYWRQGSSGPWNYTGIYASSSSWDGIDMDIDLSSDTFKLSYFISSSNTWTTLAPSGTPLGLPMNNLTTYRWHLEDNVASGVGGKNFFDDFAVHVVPAPGAATAFGVGAVLIARRRR